MLLKRWPRMLVGNPDLCTYCGGIAESRDHVIPISYIDHQERDNRSRYDYGPQTFACHYCNRMISNRIFNSFAERALWVSNTYADLAERFGGGRWTDKELRELDWPLQQMIRQRNQVGLVFRGCAAWFNSDEYLDTLEGVLYEAQLDKSHVKFREHYYQFFHSTIESVQRHVNRRSNARSAWARSG